MKTLVHQKIFFDFWKNRLFQGPSRKPSRWNIFWIDVFLLVLACLVCRGIFLYISEWGAPLEGKALIDLSISSLPLYAFFSLSRMTIAYVLSVCFSLIWGYWSAKDRFAEKVLIPLLDIFQSIPLLGFMPGAMLFFVACFPHSNAGLELASIVMIFTSQTWNLALGVYHSIRTVPEELLLCSRAYRFNWKQKLRWVELPSCAISFVWNSMMSMAGGWFFLMLSEAFQLGSKDFRLRGIGAYMSVAAESGEVLCMLYAIVAMVLVLIGLDQLVWRPLVVWSQKFRMEASTSGVASHSWFLEGLKASFLLSALKKGCRLIKEAFRKGIEKPPRIKGEKYAAWLSCGGIAALAAAIGISCFFLGKQLGSVSMEQWTGLFQKLGLTFFRVMACLGICLILAVPLGVSLGLSKKLSGIFEPILQVVASFPAPLLFPFLLWFFHQIHVPLEIGSAALMLAGSGWYILFNVIAGAQSIPSDLRLAAASFRWSWWQRCRSLYLPGIFPSLVTGLVAGAGGAWNTSIVAEYISYHGHVTEVPGLGSTISAAAQEGNIPLLTAAVFVMVCMVALWNYQIWLRLYHYSEKRYTLNV